MRFSKLLGIGLRDLRGQYRRFWVFIVCLALGVAAIAGVNAVSKSMTDSLARDGQALLGGDLSYSLIHRQATPAELAGLELRGQVSEIGTLRTMGRNGRAGEASRQRLIELKSVDTAYPLAGRVELANQASLQTQLAQQDGVWGVVVEPVLLAMLQLEVGDTLRVGSSNFQIRDTIKRETDRTISGVNSGPRVMLPMAALDDTGLVQPGSLITYSYRVLLNADGNSADVEQTAASIARDFPDAGWRVGTVADASPQTREFVTQLAMFLTLVGLSVLLVGGVGIANAVSSYMGQKIQSLATLKSLGATRRQVFAVYLCQVLCIAMIGVALGLLIGAAVPFLVLPIVTASLNLDVQATLPIGGLALAAVFGLLTALTFSVLPISAAGKTPPALLFRDSHSLQQGRAERRHWFWVVGLFLILAAIGVFTSFAPLVAAVFLAGAVVVMILFFLLAYGVQAIIRRLPTFKNPTLRLALLNLVRPGAPTPSVVLSLGLGLTLLVAIGLIQANLRYQISGNLPERIPSFFIVDMRADQTAEFDRFVGGMAETKDVNRMPMLRGKIVKLNNQDVTTLEIPEDIDWVFDQDSTRGITWATDMPRDVKLTDGSWWAPDYKGKQLVSLDAEVGTGMGLKVGDTLTINLLGREIQAEIASFREVKFEDMQINFIMIFSPGILAKAPQMHLATLEVAESDEDKVEQSLLEKFPNLTMVRVRYVLEQAQGLLSKLSNAIALVASLALVSGIFVLAGALAAGRQRRMYEAVVLKVLGSTRKQIGRSFLIEYGLLGLIAAVSACGLGILASYLLISQVFGFEFVVFWWLILACISIGLVATLGFGYLSTWGTLNAKASTYLRND